MNKWFDLILVDLGEVYRVTVVLEICLPYQLTAGHLRVVPELQGNTPSYLDR